MHPVIETLERLVRQAHETWNDEAFQKQLQDAKKRLEETVKRYPAGSVSLALAAGYLVGRMTKRTKKQ